MDTEQRYRAVAARDARFDGQFVLAVRSTGIYCRPSCPARTPLPQHAEFFDTAAAAHARGYRACKRCLPDAVPGSPQWNLRSDVAARAMRLVADGVVEREGVPGLAAHLGYSPRHLTRLLTAELGAGPLALARAHRAQTARTLLVSTDLPVTTVAHAAGFASVRQFNATVAEVYARTPSELRALRRGEPTDRPPHPSGAPARGEEPPTTLRLTLPVRQPFDGPGVLAWLAARAVPGVEDAGAEHYARTLALPGGPAWFEVRPEADRVRLTARLTSLGDVAVLVARVRRLLDLDADPVAVDEALGRDPALAGSVREIPGIRLPGAVDPHEMVLRALVGQQISVAAARTQLARLTAALGTPIGTELAGPGGLTHLFPTAAQVAEHLAGHEGWHLTGHLARRIADSPEAAQDRPDAHPGSRPLAALRGPAARTRTIQEVCRALADGSLSITLGDDPAEQHARLVARAGIGPWTAGYLAMRVLGAPDVLLTGDVALRAGARRLGLPDRPTELDRWGRALAPWRSYAGLHLWAAAARSADLTRRPAGPTRPTDPTTGGAP